MSSPLLRTFGSAPAMRYACSRAGCDLEASHAITWRNPKIHAEDRRKVWLACDEHLEYLREFLAARGFPLAVSTVTELAEESS